MRRCPNIVKNLPKIAVNFNDRLFQRLACSKIYQDYERAFSEATQMPLSLHPPGIQPPVHQSKTAVPIHLGAQIIGYLQAGKDRSRASSTVKYDAIIRLLEIFAQHLSLLSNKIALQEANAEPPLIQRAKKYIEQHKTDALSLRDVARALNVSTFYFCKLFKKSTGVKFTEYLSRVRIERAKGFLLNPNMRVSEIAFEVGFQSLTHFNRSFQRIVGRSPTAYRSGLPGGERDGEIAN